MQSSLFSGLKLDWCLESKNPGLDLVSPEGKIIGRVAQRKGSVVSGSVEDAIMGFKNFITLIP